MFVMQMHVLDGMISLSHIAPRLAKQRLRVLGRDHIGCVVIERIFIYRSFSTVAIPAILKLLVSLCIFEYVYFKRVFCAGVVFQLINGP